MILSQLEVGERCIIQEIEGRRGFRQKLALRGIREGTKVKVISRRGPITLKVGKSTVSMGRGMADKIRVRKL